MRTPPNESLSSDIADTPQARKASEPERRCILSGETAPASYTHLTPPTNDSVQLSAVRVPATQHYLSAMHATALT